jgi:hypothetical protein
VTLDRVSLWRCVAATAVLTLSCATAQPLPSDRGEKDWASVVTYEPVGDLPPCTRYLLGRRPAGLAFVERNLLGFEIEFPAHWVDSTGDHFAAWDVAWGEHGAPVSVRNGPAKEVWIPADRRQPAYLFAYRAGVYELRDISGVKRPVPTIPVEARAKLEPVPSP